jgi:predicted neuraminidase
METRLFFAILISMTLAAAPRAEFIFETAPFQSCHASTIVETPSGDLLAAWFGGTSEGHADVAIWASRKTGGTWTAPSELAREENIATFNPVLFYSKDNVLWLYYKFGPKPSEWTGARRLSRDNGHTWSTVERLPAGLYGPIKNKPVTLQSGVIISGTSVESYHSWASWIERSEDNGKTWSKHGPVVSSGENIQSIQPAIVRLPDKTLRMFVRTKQITGKICYADSRDEGLTWTALKPTSLPNPNSGIDAVTLRDGRILLVYNHTQQGRTPLNVAVSRDGNTWNNFLILESDPGEYSYPAVIQGADGTVHMTYTWNRKRIKHVQIAKSEIPD